MDVEAEPISYDDAVDINNDGIAGAAKKSDLEEVATNTERAHPTPADEGETMKRCSSYDDALNKRVAAE